jgi:tRNA threonylcarbamoyl adenosine modification protein YjeE
LVQGLGSKDSVSSPTFTLSKIYKAKDLQINHYDLYRLGQPGIIKDEVQESLENPKAITIIEWSGIVKESLPRTRFSIKFSPVAADSNERDIEITYPPAYEGIVKQLQTNWKEPMKESLSSCKLTGKKSGREYPLPSDR